MRRYSRLLIFSFVSLSLFLAAPAVYALSDIKGHWAEETINNLVNLEILHGYPDGTFRPNQSITRAEMAKILAVTFNLKSSKDISFTDTADHWAKDYIAALVEKDIINGIAGGAFHPERPVTRAEITDMMLRLLNVEFPEECTLNVTPSFTDLEDSPDFAKTEIAFRLGLLPGYYQPEFIPSRLVSRADTAWMISRLREIKVLRGEVLDNHGESGLLTVKPEQGEARLVLTRAETILLRNDLAAAVEQILAGDKVTVFFNPKEEPVFIKAYGEVTQKDLLGRLSSMLKDRLTPEQLASILAGNWDEVKEMLRGELYNEMLARGITPSEAEAILFQDWQYLDLVSRDRLSEALAGYLGITRELSRAILDRDLEKIKNYARVELVTIALSKLLEQKGA